MKLRGEEFSTNNTDTGKIYELHLYQTDDEMKEKLTHSDKWDQTIESSVQSSC